MMELFAQAGRMGAANPPPQNPAAAAGAFGFGMMFFVVYFLVLLVAIAVHIVFLVSLSKCLKEIAPRNRKMEPGQVWLNLIPVFGTVWMFLTVIRLSESLEKEFRSRGRREEGDYGKTLGLVFLISAFVCGCVTPVVWIMYWLKITGYTKLLRELPKRGREDYDDDREGDDDYDRPPSPRKRRPRDDEE